MEKEIILASASPRRKELLKLITDKFIVIPAVGEEVSDDLLSPAERVEKIACRKAVEVSEKNPGYTVIGADTTVFCGGDALGKPADEADAGKMLTRLSGRIHNVITAVAIAQTGKIVKVFSEETEVEFYCLSDEEIDRYVKSGEPMDKAGGYGIQGMGALLVKGIKGDYYNVMGLPVGRLYRELYQLRNDGIFSLDDWT